MIPEIFKYGSLVSLPLFSIVALALVWRVPEYSLRKHTVSKSILFFRDPMRRLIFRLNFIPKAVLDTGFVVYVLHKFSIPFTSVFAWCLILAASLFALLAYFDYKKHHLLHGIIIYSIGVLWAIGLMYISTLTKTHWFFWFSIVTAGFPAVIAFVYLAINKTNVWVQALCMSILYTWFVIFVFSFL